MIAATVPTMICTSLMTLPALMYSHPASNAYFYFGQILQSDPVSLIPMGIAALCTFVALAMPTSTPVLPFSQRV